METAKTTECEVRTLLSEGQYGGLKAFFTKEAVFRSEDQQETRYFEGPHDLRIQKSTSCAKVWLKKGKMHDECREEIEIRLEPERFGELERLFDTLGYSTGIVWHRHRVRFTWGDVDVSLDHTKGYGHVIELEKMSDDAGREETIRYLKDKLAELGLRPTPKPVLHERFSYYRDHWKDLLTEEIKTPA
jgi:predicted adenylyl cyclase CyaB